MSMLFVINPGATSTKVALFEDEKTLYKETIDHNANDLAGFNRIYEQRVYRGNLLRDWLSDNKVKISDLDAIVSRGGLLKPIVGGTYRINELMIADLEKAEHGEHASNLGAALAWDLGAEYGLPLFIVDPVSVDEYIPEARISGLKDIPRISLAHTLNCRAVAIQVAAEMGRPYKDLRLIVAHLGTGISITVHSGGRLIDSNNPYEAGPMCPDRAGTLPNRGLVHLAFSGKYDEYGLIKKIHREGGLYDHLGTKDLREAERMVADGNEYAALVLRAMVYQIAKEIGAMSTVLQGGVDAVIIAGGMAYSEWLQTELSKRISFIAPVIIKPGEKEMEALAEGALRVLNGQEEAREYQEDLIGGKNTAA
ncbi:MAG: butyrate kinase [Syntrophomonas sp.]